LKPQTLMLLSSLLVLLSAALNCYATYCQHCDDDKPGQAVKQMGPPGIDVAPAACDCDDKVAWLRKLGRWATNLAAALLVVATLGLWSGRRRRVE
jgi:hypothetical protein